MIQLEAICFGWKFIRLEACNFFLIWNLADTLFDNDNNNYQDAVELLRCNVINTETKLYLEKHFKKKWKFYSFSA